MVSRDPLAIRARDSVDHVERLLMLMVQRDRNNRRCGRIDDKMKMLRASQKRLDDLLARRESAEQEITHETEGEPPV